MANTNDTQLAQDVFSPQPKAGMSHQPHGGSRQDKARIASARSGTPQPAPETKYTRANRLNPPGTRTESPLVHKSRTEKLTTWVDPRVKSRLAQRAAQEGLSLSATTAAFLERSLQEDVDLQYSALLAPIITGAIKNELRGIRKHVGWWLVRVAFETGQTRTLVANLLGKQPGMTEEQLKELLATTRQTAKGNLTRRNPEFEELLADLKEWLEEQGREEPTN